VATTGSSSNNLRFRLAILNPLSARACDQWDESHRGLRVVLRSCVNNSLTDGKSTHRCLYGLPSTSILAYYIFGFFFLSHRASILPAFKCNSIFCFEHTITILQVITTLILYTSFKWSENERNMMVIWFFINMWSISLEFSHVIYINYIILCAFFIDERSVVADVSLTFRIK